MNRLLVATAFLAMTSGAALADNYTITVTNNLSEELLAPIVVTSTSNDVAFFEGNYVTPEAEEQILTGDPARIVDRIGAAMAAVGHGEAGPPGVLLAPGDSVTFEFDTHATSLRILAMVAPTLVPDHYVTNVVDIQAITEVTVTLDRFDIGHDEGTMTRTSVETGAATVVITRQ